MTRRVSGTAKPMAFAATAVLLTASSAAAQSPARSSSGASTPGAVQSPGSSAAPRVEVTQAAGGTTITVGTGSVFVGQSASAADIALTEEQTAVAREELTGSKIGIVGATTDPWSVRAIQGIQAAADALGVTVVDCLSATYSKKPTCVPREGGKQQQIVALIDLYPMTFGSPKKLVKQGFVDVVVGGGPARDGSVAVTWTDAGIGAAVGRTAGTWLTAHWPDVVPKVRVIGDQDYGFAEFLEGVTSSLAETDPTAQLVPDSDAPWNDANLIIERRLDGVRTDAGVNSGGIGISGEPFALIGLTCIGTPATPPSWLAACFDLWDAAAGATAVDVIARLKTGLSVPEQIEAPTTPTTWP